ncbi:MAG: hypothetical protein LC808_25800 [Actinobacteria bacterium]|nr:hypothetical protein [Actinomycetota bacterium]
MRVRLVGGRVTTPERNIPKEFPETSAQAGPGEQLCGEGHRRHTRDRLAYPGRPPQIGPGKLVTWPTPVDRP